MKVRSFFLLFFDCNVESARGHLAEGRDDEKYLEGCILEKPILLAWTEKAERTEGRACGFQRAEQGPKVPFSEPLLPRISRFVITFTPALE